MDGYVNPLLARITTFSEKFVEEENTLETEQADLRTELQELAIRLSDGKDVTICLQIALEDDERIYQNRS